MFELGLNKKWINQYQPKPYQFFSSRKKDDTGQLRRLSLQNLSGAFFIILLGYSVSFFWFVGEIILSCIFFNTKRGSPAI